MNRRSQDPRSRHIVIIGGGIIGCTTAYYLSRHPLFDEARHRVTILEAASVAAGASGKAGGLLAKWAYPVPLVALSYRLHAELAAEHGGEQRWGYRKIGCGHIEAVGQDPAPLKQSADEMKAAAESLAKEPQLVPTAGGQTTDARFVPVGSPAQNQPREEVPKEWEKLPKQDVAAASLLILDSPLPKDLDWFDGRCVKSWAEMGVPGTTETAQVHPLHFTTSIAQFARETGVNIIEGAKVTKIETDPKLGVQGVVYTQRSIHQAQGSLQASAEEPAVHIDDATEVVVCAGPWTGRLLPKSKIGGPRAHSVVYDVDVSPYAVFSEIKLPLKFVPDHRRKMGQERTHKDVVDPEVYARPFSEVYACGETDHTLPLPETADLVEANLQACDDITAYLSTISPTLGSAPVKARQACYLPVHTRFGKERGPLIGKTVTPGLYVASGHSCWGIQNGPATGKLMSELLLEGRTKSANIDKFDPRKVKVGAGVDAKTARKEV